MFIHFNQVGEQLPSVGMNHLDHSGNSPYRPRCRDDLLLKILCKPVVCKPQKEASAMERHPLIGADDNFRGLDSEDTQRVRCYHFVIEGH